MYIILILTLYVKCCIISNKQQGSEWSTHLNAIPGSTHHLPGDDPRWTDRKTRSCLLKVKARWNQEKGHELWQWIYGFWMTFMDSWMLDDIMIMIKMTFMDFGWFWRKSNQQWEASWIMTMGDQTMNQSHEQIQCEAPKIAFSWWT